LSWKAHPPLHRHCSPQFHEGADNGALSVAPAGLWPVPQQYDYNKPSCSCLWPLHFLSPSARIASPKARLCRCPSFQLYPIVTLFALSVAFAHYGRLTRMTMRRRRETTASSRTVTTESSTPSPGITDDDRSFEPNFETDLTESERPSSPDRKAKRRKTGRDPASKCLRTDFEEFKPSDTENITDVSAAGLILRGRYDPADDTDEDLSKVPEDYGKSDKTRKHNLRLKNRWAWSVSTWTKLFFFFFFKPLSLIDRPLTHMLSGTVGSKQSSRQPIRNGKTQRTLYAKPLRMTCTGF
jgi:hypothetical protein